VIRPAAPPDVPDLLRLVRALAAYEREPDAVVTTEEDLGSALFGPSPLARALVAESGGRLVGMAIWFPGFSTWTGRGTLYLEDLFVEEAERGRGLGRALVAALAAIAVESGWHRMDWSVLDWNAPSIAFYRGLGARPMAGWTGWRLERSGLEALAGSTGGAGRQAGPD
jgi:GNAT superfamily N-acetyltransferase